MLKDIVWLNSYKKKMHIYSAYKRLTSDLKTHTERNGRMGKGIPCKWKSKESWGSNNYIRQNRLYNKDCNKRQEGYYIMTKRSI